MLHYKKNKALYKLCVKNNIPIVRKKTARLINKIISKNKYHSMLEIGTAYGFSCSLWVQNKHLKAIYSIEKNTDNYKIAKIHLNLDEIHLFNDDALSFQFDREVDLIFLDGPKSNQETLVLKYFDCLSDNGTFIIDNLILKKIRNNPLNKNHYKLIEKLDKFIEFLKNSELWTFKFLNLDDGIGILTRK